MPALVHLQNDCVGDAVALVIYEFTLGEGYAIRPEPLPPRLESVLFRRSASLSSLSFMNRMSLSSKDPLSRPLEADLGL